MGIEQGKPVVGSSIDLPSNIDLPDLRLPRAFKAWATFRQNHAQIAGLGALPVEEVVALGDKLATSISRAIGIESLGEFRGISKSKIGKVTEFVSGKGSKVIFMRHGEQSPPEWVFSIPQPALRRVRMLQNPFNTEDLLTNGAFVDAFLTAFSLFYITKITGKNLRVLTSENLRAKEPAEIISTVIPDSTFTVQLGLNSITYRDETDKPPVSVEDLLDDLPSGFMPWEPKLVDKLCKDSKDGIKRSEVIMQTIDGLVSLGTQKEGDDLYVVLTHSQQLAEVLRFVGKLPDSSVRFPELTMIAMNNPSEALILNNGVLREESNYQRSRNMRKNLERLGEGYEWYRIRRAEYETDQKIPFLVGPEPLYLSGKEGDEVLRIGRDVVDFMEAADELYRSEGEVKDLLDKGKPPFFQGRARPNYLFIRPDLLITKGGFAICEIEISPFGLGLAELLNRAYRLEGFNTMVQDGVLSEMVASNTPDQGTIVYSQKTSSYSGQLQFLAKEIFSGEGRDWGAAQIDDVLGIDLKNVYRGFYTYEHLSDLFINNLVQGILDDQEKVVMPSLTPHMEEKALLALIWDRRWEPFLTAQLGSAAFTHLREIIPPTWLIGQEEFFAPGLPQGIIATDGLAALSKAKRNFVLKRSGFSSGSSWAEGVTFLQDKSVAKAAEAIRAAQADTQSLFIVQEFRSSQERPMSYDQDGAMQQMSARIRLTPYFSMAPDSRAKLIAIKATGCENTNYIHASTGSINTAVVEQDD